MNIDKLSFEDLRALGHNLEPVVSHSVRGTSTDELKSVVSDAITEAKRLDPEALASVLAKFKAEDIDDEPEDEAVKTDADAEEGDSEGDDKAKVEEGQGEADEVVCFQVYSHMTEWGVRRRDIIINPEPKLARKVLMGVSHKKLTLKEALLKAATRTAQVNRRVSRLDDIKGI